MPEMSVAEGLNDLYLLFWSVNNQKKTISIQLHNQRRSLTLSHLIFDTF